MNHYSTEPRLKISGIFSFIHFTHALHVLVVGVGHKIKILSLKKLAETFIKLWMKHYFFINVLL